MHSDMTAFVQSAADVIENVRLAHNTYRIRLNFPELARLIRPGQFVMLRLPGRTRSASRPSLRALRHRPR